MFLPCGCEIEIKGKIFYINPCSENCKYYKYIFEQSVKRGNKIEFDMRYLKRFIKNG